MSEPANATLQALRNMDRMNQGLPPIMDDDTTPTPPTAPAGMTDEEAVDASAEIAYWQPKVAALDDYELVSLYTTKNRAFGHFSDGGALNGTTVELSYMRRELERRLAGRDGAADRVNRAVRDGVNDLRENYPLEWGDAVPDAVADIIAEHVRASLGGES